MHCDPVFDVAFLIHSLAQLCCAVLGCWLTDPLNRRFGRRGTIFICAFLSFVTCIWQGVTNSWEHLFVARFVLGLGIGPKSSTVPVYAAECTPPAIRGALVMMWQMWTAFGIMLGYSADLALFKVKDPKGITGLNWRLMLASVPNCIHYSAYIQTNIRSRPVYQLSSSWHKSFSAPNRLVGSYQKAGTRMLSSHWIVSVVTLCKPPEISTVRLSLLSSNSSSSFVRHPRAPRGGA